MHISRISFEELSGIHLSTCMWHLIQHDLDCFVVYITNRSQLQNLRTFGLYKDYERLTGVCKKPTVASPTVLLMHFPGVT